MWITARIWLLNSCSFYLIQNVPDEITSSYRACAAIVLYLKRERWIMRTCSIQLAIPCNTELEQQLNYAYFQVWKASRVPVIYIYPKRPRGLRVKPILSFSGLHLCELTLYSCNSCKLIDDYLCIHLIVWENIAVTLLL